MRPADLTLSAGPNDVSRGRQGGARRADRRTTTTPCSRSASARPRTRSARIFRQPQPRDHPHAGRGDPRPGGGRAQPRPARDDVPEPRVGRLRQGLRLLARARSARSCTRSRCPTTTRSRPEAVDAYLTSHPAITVVSVVHSETPSGTLNPVRDIGPIARRHGAVTVVDVVSSFGGIELEPEGGSSTSRRRARRSASAAHPACRCMAVSEQAWAAIDANPDAPRDSFLSITRLARAVARQGPLPVHALGLRPPRRATPRPTSCSPRASTRRSPRHQRVVRCRAGPAWRRWACGRGRSARRSRRPA